MLCYRPVSGESKCPRHKSIFRVFCVLRALRDSDNQIMDLTQEKHKTRCLWLEITEFIFLSSLTAPTGPVEIGITDLNT